MLLQVYLISVNYIRPYRVDEWAFNHGKMVEYFVFITTIHIIVFTSAYVLVSKLRINVNINFSAFSNFKVKLLCVFFLLALTLKAIDIFVYNNVSGQNNSGLSSKSFFLLTLFPIKFTVLSIFFIPVSRLTKIILFAIF
jgi:hypothetical protein